MYRKRSPQVNLFESTGLVPPEKAKRLQSSWAEVFRKEALPLIDEDRFAPLYSEGIGRPNMPVQIVLRSFIHELLLRRQPESFPFAVPAQNDQPHNDKKNPHG